MIPKDALLLPLEPATFALLADAVMILTGLLLGTVLDRVMALFGLGINRGERR